VRQDAGSSTLPSPGHGSTPGATAPLDMMGGGRILWLGTTMSKRILRVSAVVSLAAIAALLLTSAGASLWHRHDSRSEQVCQVCRIGHLPLLQLTFNLGTPAPALIAWHLPAEEFCRDLDPVFSSNVPRAPPA
jgi:hypothetical protein